MFVVSPFLDAKTVHAASDGAGAKTRRALVSTAMELQRLLHEDDKVFTVSTTFGFSHSLIFRLKVRHTRDEEIHAAVEPLKAKNWRRPDLHAKLFFAAKGTAGSSG